ncbi:hypothetical protein DPP27_24525 [Salmonella enterica subsp. enterica serovar Virchow]|nr:hypothetical protein [Salmonella enterica subsp. enterica serovar Virchow]EKN6335471.1 hypothetical protein [Yersinia enterocolitica]
MEDSSPPAGYPRGPELAPAGKAKQSAEGESPEAKRSAEGESPEALGIEARRGETACLARCAARKPGPQGTP